MDCEEDMLDNLQRIRAQNPGAITWLYRNGVKALPWFTSVRTLLEVGRLRTSGGGSSGTRHRHDPSAPLQDPAYWGFFMPYANCSSAPGVYVCGPNATANLYHDFEQTPSGDCGAGVQCGAERAGQARGRGCLGLAPLPTASSSPLLRPRPQASTSSTTAMRASGRGSCRATSSARRPWTAPTSTAST
jgi:hypothetical protein